MFALRWENASSGKSGWSPPARGGWANKQARKNYLPLTDDVMVRHLRGGATVGYLPVDARRYVHALACDFDGGTWVLPPLGADGGWTDALVLLCRCLNPARRHRSNPRLIKCKMPKWHLKRARHLDWPQPTGPPTTTI